MAKFKFFSVGGESDTDTNTNLANTDLSNSATRTFDINGNTLTFEDGGTNIIKLDNADNTLKIGNTTPYEMPTSRASKKYESLVASDTIGNVKWIMQQANGCLNYSANIGTIADNEYAIIGQGNKFGSTDLDNITFAELSPIPAWIPTGQTNQIIMLNQYHITIAMTETGIGKGGCLLGLTNGGASGSTDFDMSGNTTTIGNVNIAGTTNQLNETADKSTTPVSANKKYYFYIENQSGASFTNVYVWFTIWYQTQIYTN
jgi:hypothetical protein